MNDIDVHMRVVKTAIGPVFKGSETMQFPTVNFEHLVSCLFASGNYILKWRFCVTHDGHWP